MVVINLGSQRCSARKRTRQLLKLVNPSPNFSFLEDIQKGRSELVNTSVSRQQLEQIVDVRC